MHTSYPSEIHYFPIMNSPHPILLHTHSSAPYVRDISSRGLNLTLYSSASSGCISGFDIQVDWWSTFGRWGSRYSMTVLSWAVGVVALVLFVAWGAGDVDSEYSPSFIRYHTPAYWLTITELRTHTKCRAISGNFYL